MSHHIVAIPGSLRRRSINRALLRAAASLAPDGLEIEIVPLNDVPLYDGDVEAEGVPDGVVALREKVASADGILIAVPEYNHGAPGVLKNAVDWLSRPPKPHPFDGRPVGVMGATPGQFGTRAAQYQLRQTLTALNAPVLPQPQMLVFGAGDKFDDDLELVDEGTRKFLGRYLSAFAEWVDRFRDT